MVTKDTNFYQGYTPQALIEKFGSPLYVYNEQILRNQCKNIMALCKYPHYRANYAMKANTNISLMSIIREEGLYVDVSSIGEAICAQAAGYAPQQMLFIVNGISATEMQQIIDMGAVLCVDSISQLLTYAQLNPGGEVALRFNPGVGGGHHANVVTGGDGTKFGITPEHIPRVHEILLAHKLQLIGITHHIGSQNWGDVYMQGVHAILKIAQQFKGLKFIDLGGGFATPYHKQDGEGPMDLVAFGSALDTVLFEFAAKYGDEIMFIVEPGRYIAAECGVLLGTANATKQNGAIKYVGTDLGFSVFARTTLYSSHHDIEVYQKNTIDIDNKTEVVSIVGNQCESGDYIAKNRSLPLISVGDIVGVLDAGAYGYSMASNYNHRPRPAEVLITCAGEVKLIRRSDTLEDMIRNMKDCYV